VANKDAGRNSGSAYICNVLSGIWTQVVKLFAAGAAAGDFGLALALSGDAAVVGAWSNDDSGFRSGSAFIFNVVGAYGDDDAALNPAIFF